VIEIRGLDFAYEPGGFRLSVPELGIETGEHVAFVGPSGCGKTSLVYLIAGILLPKAGSIAVDGLAIERLSDAARRAFRISRIGFVFQQFELLDYLPVLDNILLPNFVSPALPPPRAMRIQARDLAGRLGVGDKLRRFPQQLSHGERQRVAVCRALLNAPDIVIADEPTGNLDPAMAASIMDLIHAEARRREATLLTVTHDRALLAAFDRVLDLQSFSAGSGSSGA